MFVRVKKSGKFPSAHEVEREFGGSCEGRGGWPESVEIAFVVEDSKTDSIAAN